MTTNEFPIDIGVYTGAWQDAVRPTAPAIGYEVRVSHSADARETDDLRRCLRQAGRELEFIGTIDDDVDQYQVVTLGAHR